ncbi:RND efflux system, outer membrane lipoprotein, NodT family [Coraliomargarita akajimensis DSM 45221]|uniref:RND efflux system, outer membrane lipoprotein, NodT family n=2 Tax=Coraliomargarita TaxID=442430 RepID=D5ENC1_CORAD|nr:RND efflux system, outer membrane lipoprotein, NodT family [Coraliomargarita akajimensis DSM 45221]
MTGVSVLGLFGLTGCKIVGTDYEEPELVMPDAWHQRLADEAEAQTVVTEQWWGQFNDPVLVGLVDSALAANLDLAIAYERVVQAREAKDVSKSGLWPSVDATAGFSRERNSENVGLSPAAGGGSTRNYYSTGLDVAWELDVFGGVQRAVESADANLMATEESYRDFMVLLAAEVAGTYIELRTINERMELAEANIANQEESLKLALDRFDAGLAPKLDVSQAQTNLSNTQAFLPQLKQSRTAELNRLATLLGLYAADVELLLGEAEGSIPVPPNAALSTIPVDMVRARPDIRAAERSLAAQNARIGVAAADLYPRFFLNGSFNLLATDSSNWIDAGSRSFGWGPGVRWNLFNAGRVRSQVAIEESATRAAYYSYENSVLLAVEEVENSMSGIVNGRERLQALEQGTEAAREAVSLVKENYSRGLVDFQNVLDSERTLTQTEDNRALSQGSVASAYVGLFKALGGGFAVDVEIVEPAGVATADAE